MPAPFSAILSLALSGLLGAESAAAANQAAPMYPQFTVRMHREKGGTLPYRLLIPKDYTPGKAWPLIVWLHGSGGKGTGNTAQLANIIGTFLDGADAAKCPAFVLAPQCPDGESWCPVGVNQVPAINGPTRMTIATIAELLKEFSLDDRRIYIGGYSMGAYGVWEFIGRYPNLFAAAFPIAGTPAERVAMAPLLKELPIWVFHGDRDENAAVGDCRKMVAALRAVGGKVKYTEYAGMGHGCAAALAEPQLPAWFFAQRRPTAPSFTPANIPEAAHLIIRALPNGTHGTWTGVVQHTAHGAARLPIEGTRYRLKPAPGAGPAVTPLLQRIGKGEVNGRFRVTGTVEHSDYVWLVVESLEVAADVKP